MKIIDMNTWSRKEIYDMFSSLDWPFYSVTVPIDVTNVKTFSKYRNLSFYHLMVWVCTKAINSVEEYRIRLRDGKLVCVDKTNPSFTYAEKDEETFRIITMEWEEDSCEFCEKARARSEMQTSFITADATSDNLIYFTSLPWFDFTNMTNERSFNRDDFIPRLGWGKYYAENDRLFVHLSIEVNHRVIDGKHLGELKAAIDREIAALDVGAA